MTKNKRAVKWRLHSFYYKNKRNNDNHNNNNNNYHNFEVDDKILATLDSPSSSKRQTFKSRYGFWRKPKVSTTSSVIINSLKSKTATIAAANTGNSNSSHNVKSCYRPLLQTNRPQRQQQQPIVARVQPATIANIPSTTKHFQTLTSTTSEKRKTIHSRVASFLSLSIKRHWQQPPIQPQQSCNKFTYSTDTACCSCWQQSKCCSPFFKRFLNNFRYFHCCYNFSYKCCCFNKNNNAIDDDEDDIDAKIAAYIHEFQQQQISAFPIAICVDSHDLTWLRAANFSSTATVLPLPVTTNTSNKLNRALYKQYFTHHHHNHYYYDHDHELSSKNQQQHLSHKRRIWTWDDSLRSNSDRFLMTLEEQLEEDEKKAKNLIEIANKDYNYSSCEEKRSEFLEVPFLSCNLKETLIWMLPVMLCAVMIGGMFNLEAAPRVNIVYDRIIIIIMIVLVKVE